MRIWIALQRGTISLPMPDESDIEKATRLANEINDLVETLLASSEELSAFESAVPNLSNIPPPRGVGEWQDLRKKVVRLDAAIMAIHLLAARVSFHGYAKIVADEIKNVVAMLAKTTLRTISIWSVVADVLRKLLSLYDLIVSAINDDAMTAKTRDGGYRHRQSLAQSNLLLRGHDQRDRRKVSTRH
jgi:hypothetical protein